MVIRIISSAAKWPHLPVNKFQQTSSLLQKRLNHAATKMAPIAVNSEEGSLLKPLLSKGLIVEHTKNPKPKVDPSKLVFGHTFTDHMLTCEWNRTGGWSAPKILSYGNLSIPPSSSVFHYAIECFEGLKAYRDRQGTIRLFRPDLNMKRFLASAERLALPAFKPTELLALIKALIRTDAEWVPEGAGYSLYIRPTLIGTQESLGVAPPNKALLFVICSPVGPYYKTGFAAVSLYAEEDFVRAWPGGTGAFKIGANYAPGILPQTRVYPAGYHQVLWLFGPERQITEVGTMNCFLFWKDEAGNKELVTPPLTDGTILPGVTRDSILALSREWGEFKVSERPITMAQLTTAISEGRVLEMFGAGTAAVISPIRNIYYQGKDWAVPLDPSDPTSQAGPLAKRLWKAITDIQYGVLPHKWSVIID